MARYRGQKALYEVIGRSQSEQKSRRNRLVEALHGDPEPRAKQDASQEPRPIAHNDQIRWEPRAIQFNAGRVELALPYPVVFVLVLGVLVAIMAAFKLGQRTGPGRSVGRNLGPAQKTAPKQGKSKTDGPSRNPGAGQTTDKTRIGQRSVDATVRPGNAIVIQQHRVLADLVPVKRFFAEQGITTEIIKTNNTFFLVTKQRFSGDPNRQGSPGYRLEQRIAECGTKYQAPPGRATFDGFDDAYGRYFSEDFQGEVVNVN